MENNGSRLLDRKIKYLSILIIFLIISLINTNVLAYNIGLDVNSSSKTDDTLYNDLKDKVKDLKEIYKIKSGYEDAKTEDGDRVRYNWLHAIEDIKANTSGLSYVDIGNWASSNAGTEYGDQLVKAAKGVYYARKEIGSFVGRSGIDVTNGKVTLDWVIWTPFGEKDIGGKNSNNSEVLSSPRRAIEAFNKITKENLPTFTAKEYQEDETVREKVNSIFTKYDKSLFSLNQKLNAAVAFYYKGPIGDDTTINIMDGYKTKFKYSMSQIYSYDSLYSIDRVRPLGDDTMTETEKNQLMKCWGAKAAAEAAGRPNVARDTSIYVRKKDDKNTKLNYNHDEIWLYLQIFNPSTKEFLGFSGKDADEVAVNWANKLEGASRYNTNSATSVKDAYVRLTKVENVVNIGLQAIQNHTDAIIENTKTAEFDADDSTEASVADKEKEAKVDPDKDIDFSLPKNVTSVAANGPSDVVNDAEELVSVDPNNQYEQSYIKNNNLQSFSQNLYSILLGIGIVLAVIIGMILGIKLMLAPVGQKAEAKKLLIPYAVGCAVVFGAFGIWQLVVSLMQEI